MGMEGKLQVFVCIPKGRTERRVGVDGSNCCGNDVGGRMGQQAQSVRTRGCRRSIQFVKRVKCEQQDTDWRLGRWIKGEHKRGSSGDDVAVGGRD